VLTGGRVPEHGWGARSISRALVAACASLVLLALAATDARAAAPVAHGSAEQVYATGLKPGARTALLDSRGDVVDRQRAGELGGVVYREVKPGAGYRLKAGGATSAPVQVLSTRPAPPSGNVYDQDIPASGYGYLRTRDGTKLAIYVHPPSDVTTPGPTPPPFPRRRRAPTPPSGTGRRIRARAR